MEDWEGYMMNEVVRKLRSRGVLFQAADTLPVRQQLQMCKYEHSVRLSKEVMGTSADSIATYTRYHIDCLVRLIEVSMDKDCRLSTGIQIYATDQEGDKVVRFTWTQMGYSQAVELDTQVSEQQKKHRKQAQNGYLKDFCKKLPFLFDTNYKREVFRVLDVTHCPQPCGEEPECPGHATIQWDPVL